MDDILQKIVAVKHEEICAAKLKRSLASLREEAEQRGDQRGFAQALQAKVAAGYFTDGAVPSSRQGKHHAPLPDRA